MIFDNASKLIENTECIKNARSLMGKLQPNMSSQKRYEDCAARMYVNEMFNGVLKKMETIMYWKDNGGMGYLVD